MRMIAYLLSDDFWKHFEEHGAGAGEGAGQTEGEGQIQEHFNLNGYGNVEYNIQKGDSISYQGQLRNGKPHGTGVFTMKSESVAVANRNTLLVMQCYHGIFEDGKPKGLGIEKFRGFREHKGGNQSGGGTSNGISVTIEKLVEYGNENGNENENKNGGIRWAHRLEQRLNGELQFTYQGQINFMLQRHGEGICELPDGRVIDGVWEKGRIVWGKEDPCLEDHDPFTYIGEYTQYNQGGMARVEFLDGDVYVGEFTDGFPNGKGRMEYNDGDVCEGSWLYGDRHGWIQMKTKNGEERIGEFRLGLQCGRGILRFQAGDFREEVRGVFESNEIKFGTMKTVGGDVYHGNFRNEEMHDKGCLFCSTQSAFFEGDFTNGVASFGKLTYSDGSIYRGEVFQEGLPEAGRYFFLRNGRGTLSYTDGDCVEGLWENDELLSSAGCDEI